MSVCLQVCIGLCSNVRVSCGCVSVRAWKYCRGWLAAPVHAKACVQGSSRLSDAYLVCLECPRLVDSPLSSKRGPKTCCGTPCPLCFLLGAGYRYCMFEHAGMRAFPIRLHVPCRIWACMYSSVRASLYQQPCCAPIKCVL